MRQIKFRGFNRKNNVFYRDGSWLGRAADGWRTLIEGPDEPIRDKLYYVEVIGNIHDNPELLQTTN